MSHPHCLIARDSAGRFRAVITDGDHLSARLFRSDHRGCTIARVPVEAARRTVQRELALRITQPRLF